MRSERRSSAPGKHVLRVVGPFVPIVFALMLASHLSIDLLSSARAYVGGESLWSKGQKDAVLHLIRYGETHDEDEFNAYQRAIAVPLGDSEARVERQRVQPDLNQAAAALIAGGNHPGDIPGMIRLVLAFHRLPPLERAITLWTQADAEVQLLRDFAEQLHAAVLGGDHGAAETASLMFQIRESNARLTQLEDAFSDSLGEVSRLVRDLLIPAIDVVSILLLAAGIGLAVPGLHKELKLREALSRSEERHMLAISGSNDGLWDWDLCSNAFYFSAHCARMLGYDEGELAQSFTTLLALIHPDDFASVELKLHGHLQDNLPFDAEFRLRTKTNTDLWVRSRGRVVRNTDGLAQRMAGSLTDITGQKRAEQAREREHAARLTHDATHDTLTGLINRVEFERRLADAMQRGQSENCAHVLMYLDLDQFKVVNDTCGHATGDELIQQLVPVMVEELRKSDTLARLGGDEFGVLLEYCTAEDGERVAESLREAIARFRFVHRTRSFTPCVSIGMLCLDADVSHVAEALSAVDAACYLAKQRGRNRVQVYQPHDNAVRAFHGEMEWASRTHAALVDGRFALHAQEVVPLQADSGTGRHIELLVRMVDEQGQLVPPMKFIPACERYNLMPTLDRWVIDAGFAELGRLRGANQADIAVCGFNLSAASLSDDLLPEHIRERAALHGIPLDIICFEITETAAISNLTQAASFIRQLQAMGCRFALDDFGAGMSSFSYLKHLPADFIKIDGGFVREMFDDPVNMVVIEAIQRIAQAMGMKTVAEWVDSNEALTHLRELGVDYAQGFGVGRPVHFAGRLESGLQNIVSTA